MIDIIIPVFNVGKYLEKCINSVLEQDYTDYRIILVDDGSQDNSGKICDTYCSKDSRIIVIHKENGGLSSARNAGLDIAKGEYIFFLDSDDSLCENALRVLHDAITESGADSVFGGYKSVDENDNVINTYAIDERILKGNERFNIIYEFTFANMVWGKLYKRKLFENVRFDEGKLHEDVFIYHKLAYNAESIYCITTPVINYLQRSDSIMGKKFSKRNYHAVDALFERVYFLREKKLDNAAEQAINYIYKYLIFIIHKIDFSNDELSDMFDDYYAKWKQLSQYNHDRQICAIKFAYRHKLLRKPFFSFTPVKIARKARIVIQARHVLFKIICNNFHINPNFILISTPVHGNLGDQAIVYAQRIFLKDNGIKNIIEIKSVDYLKYKGVLRRVIRKKDVIIVDGGGNIGTLWPTEAERINDIVTRFKNNKVIIFPETAYFSQNFSGKLGYKITQKAFSSNKNLSVFLRDEPSYCIIKNMLPEGNVCKCPDIVNYLKGKIPSSDIKRTGALLCLRNDVEKASDEGLKSRIISSLQQEGISYNETDTVVSKLISDDVRKDELEKKFAEFSAAEFVITDRLHGMIFAYITNTPCIAINNINKKVENQYQWIKQNSDIILLDEKHNLEQAISEIRNRTAASSSVCDDGPTFYNLKEAVCCGK